MDFTECMKSNNSVLMEGALGERLKREYQLVLDENVVMSNLVYSAKGRDALANLWNEYADIAATYQLPFLATTPTRRTNIERVSWSGYDADIILDNVKFLREVQTAQKAEMYCGGLIGCKGDAYTGEDALDVKESMEFHTWEVELFAKSGVDFLYPALIPNVKEALGIALAIEQCNVPYMISFTIKQDGCLIDGTQIVDAIEYIDSMTSNHPVCYMTNCIHPQFVYEALAKPFNQNAIVQSRFRGIQANTSMLTYEELDDSKDLKTSDPVELAKAMLKLREINPFQIFGGCCGTDGRHMGEIAKLISK